MDRTADTTKSTDLYGSGKHGFTEGTPGVTPRTRIRATDLNAFQEEIVRTIEGAGLVPDDSDLGQLNDAIDTLIADSQAAIMDQQIQCARASVAQDRIYDTGGSVNGYVAVANENANFVMVGASAVIRNSTDGGDSWTDQTAASAYAGTFFGLACAPSGNFVAVAESGKIQYSSNGGDSWTQVMAGSSYSSNFAGVIYSSRLSLFVAWGASGEIQTSPTGVTWTRRRSGGGTIETVVETATHLVAISSTYRSRSTDGTTWGADITGTLSSGGLDVAGADLEGSNILACAQSGGFVNYYISTDSGLTFSAATLAEDDAEVSAIFCYGGVFYVLELQDGLMHVVSLDGSARYATALQSFSSGFDGWSGSVISDQGLAYKQILLSDGKYLRASGRLPPTPTP